MEMYLKDIESTELKDTKSELVLPIVLKLLTKHNLKHWLRAGTTLGIFRDGKLIENDSDIDISILNDKFNFFDFLKDMESEGFEVIRHIDDRDVPFQYILEHKEYKTRFDFYNFYPKLGDYETFSWNGGYFRLPKRFLGKLKSTKILKGFFLPDNTAEYLTYLYGDWKTKRHIRSRMIRNNREVVYVTGCWDILHYGHIRHLERCAKLGHLIVGVDTDEYYEAIKGKKPLVPFKQRLEIVRSLKFVWVAQAHDFKSDYEVFKKERIDTYVISDEYKLTPKFKADRLKSAKKAGANIVINPYTQGISSTKIKEALK